MSERVARIARTTKETDIDLSVGLDGTGKTDVETGIGFFDHMLTAFGRHGLFDLQVRCKGDLEVDGHHSVEDTGIVMGQAFAQALGDKRGIRRFGDIAMPMDEALIMAAVDISGRGQLYWDADVPAVMVGAFDATLAKEFFIAFAANAGVTLHIRQLAGENTHHVIEGMFKAVARAMRQACEPDPRMGDALPSTKGMPYSPPRLPDGSLPLRPLRYPRSSPDSSCRRQYSPGRTEARRRHRPPRSRT